MNPIKEFLLRYLAENQWRQWKAQQMSLGWNDATDPDQGLRALFEEKQRIMNKNFKPQNEQWFKEDQENFGRDPQGLQNLFKRYGGTL